MQRGTAGYKRSERERGKYRRGAPIRGGEEDKYRKRKESEMTVQTSEYVIRNHTILTIYLKIPIRYINWSINIYI